MHNRIFVIKSDWKDIEGDFLESIMDEESIRLSINVDYVVRQQQKQFIRDIYWFTKVYNIDFFFKDTNIKEYPFVGVITSESIKKWISKLTDIKAKQVDKARELLRKNYQDIDCWEVADAIYPRHSFWFDIDGELLNETDILEVLNKMDVCELYITASYDYHF